MLLMMPYQIVQKERINVTAQCRSF